MLLGATKKNAFLWLLLSSISLAPIFFSNSGFAASNRQTCKSEAQAPDAASVYTACNLCFDGSGNKIGSGREGAVWINTKDNNSSSSQSAFISGDEAIRNNDGKTFTAYLHGSFFNCNGSSVSALDAKYVHIIPANQSSWNGDPDDIDKNEYMVGSEPSDDLDFVTLQSRVLYRGSGSTPSLQWSNITGLSPLELTINVDGMKNYAKQSGHACIVNETDDNESADGLEKEISQISCVVGIWRCPSSANGVTENCWANHAELVVKEFEKLVPMNVKGKVTVKDANNTSNKATTEWRTKKSVLPSCSTEYCVPFDDINNMPIQIQIKEDEEAKIDFTYNLKRKSGRESDTIKYAIVSSTNTSTRGRVRDTAIISTDEPWTETETVTWPSSKGNGEICKRLDFKSPRHNVPVQLSACANITILQDDADYQAEARVKFGSNDEQSTGLQQDYTKTVKYSVEKGTTAQILFTHYGYSSLKKTEEIKWRLTVPEIPSEYNTGGRGDDRTISSPMTVKQDNGLFTTDIRPTFQSDYGSITFNSVGTFKFCEKIVKRREGVKGVGICLQIKVTEPGDPGGGDPPGGDTDPPVLSCSEHAPDTYGKSTQYAGTTSTWSYVATSDGTRSAESNGSIWAKPGDYVHFEHCYFPGAQAVRTNSDSPTHITDPTDEDRVHMPTYTTEVNGIVSNQTFDHSIGNLTKIVAGNNRFEINTSKYDLLSGGNNIHFSITGSNFTPSTAYGYSALVTGERGNTSDAKTTTNNLEILTKAAGQTISQAIYGSDANAQIVRDHKSHSGSWSYNYPIKHTVSGSSDSAENPAGCPTGPTHDAAVLADGVTKSGSIDCDTKNPYIDQEEVVCGEDDEDCTPQKQLSHYQWTETYYTVGQRTAYWTINDINDETGDFANYWTAPSSGGTASTSVSVNIPYNYINSISVAFANGDIYSGETFGVSQATATVSKRNNAATHGEYATITPTTTAKLYVFHSDKDLTGISVGSSSGQGDCTRYSNIGGHDCMIAKTETKALNSGMNMAGSSDDTFFAGQSYNVYDLKAGEYMCIGSSIWPSASASDTDMSSTGNNTAAYSAPVCKAVYKRPTFQIWNGGLYAAGKVDANSFTKNVLNGYASYQTSGSIQQYTFSSWIEQGIVVNKGIYGLASGAATGFTSNNDGKLTNDPGGIAGTNFCDLSTLTIPNTSCGRLGSINFVSAGLQRAKNTIYDTVYNAIINGRTYKAVSGAVNLADATNYNEATPGMRYTESSDSSTLTISSSSPLTRNQSHVIHAKGNLVINSNLSYDNSISYTTSSQVPQYMIFADGNININCGVSRIDAWLVAKGTINTCADVAADDVNNEARSNQLIVRGVLIADKLELTRTYGASTGNASGIPAEIFILSATNRFFGKTSSSEDPTLYTVYLRELSPRY